MAFSRDLSPSSGGRRLHGVQGFALHACRKRQRPGWRFRATCPRRQEAGVCTECKALHCTPAVSENGQDGVFARQLVPRHGRRSGPGGRDGVGVRERPPVASGRLLRSRLLGWRLVLAGPRLRLGRRWLLVAVGRCRSVRLLTIVSGRRVTVGRWLLSRRRSRGPRWRGWRDRWCGLLGRRLAL